MEASRHAPQRAPVTTGRVLRLRRLMRSVRREPAPVQASPPAAEPPRPEGLADAVRAGAQATAGAAVEAGRALLAEDLVSLHELLWDDEAKVLELIQILFLVDAEGAEEVKVELIAEAIVPFVGASWTVTTVLADSGTS